MLLDLPFELLRLISFALPLSDLTRLLRCHSHFRFLDSELSWELRFRHETVNTEYAQAPKILVDTWREFYRLSLQRLFVADLSTDKRKLFDRAEIRPLYITDDIIVDLLGHNYQVDDTLTLIPLEWTDRVHCLVNRITLKTKETFVFYINGQQQLVVRGKRTPTRVVLYEQVRCASCVLEFERVVLVLVTCDNRVLYCYKDIEKILNCDITWTSLAVETKDIITSISCSASLCFAFKIITTAFGAANALKSICTANDGAKRRLHIIHAGFTQPTTRSFYPQLTSLVHLVARRNRTNEHIEYGLDCDGTVLTNFEDFYLTKVKWYNLSLFEIGSRTQPSSERWRLLNTVPQVRINTSWITSLETLVGTNRSRQEIYIVPYGTNPKYVN